MTGLPARKKRVPAVNRKRKAKRFQEDFGGAEYVAHIKSLPCALCGVVGYSEAAHVKSRGAGGKASDIVPLCGRRVEGYRQAPSCHFMYDTRRVSPVAREHLKAKAAELWAAFTENSPND